MASALPLTTCCGRASPHNRSGVTLRRSGRRLLRTPSARRTPVAQRETARPGCLRGSATACADSAGHAGTGRLGVTLLVNARVRTHEAVDACRAGSAAVRRTGGVLRRCYRSRHRAALVAGRSWRPEVLLRRIGMNLAPSGTESGYTSIWTLNTLRPSRVVHAVLMAAALTHAQRARPRRQQHWEHYICQD